MPLPHYEPAVVEQAYLESPTVKAAMEQLGVKSTATFYQLLRHHGIEPGARLSQCHRISNDSCIELMKLKGTMPAPEAGKMFGVSGRFVRAIWNYERRADVTAAGGIG